MAERRRGFAACAVTGVAATGVAALAGSRTWLRAGGEAVGTPVEVAASGAQVAPGAGALALVGLATWGVLLVTRGRVRRVVAILGTLAAATGLGLTVLARQRLQDRALALLADRGAEDVTSSATTAWIWVAAVAFLAAVVAGVVASVRAATWPELGSRYDAPGAAGAAPRTEPTSDRDLWDQLDRGQDPTSRPPSEPPG